MKCNSCRYLHFIFPCLSNPYSEYACIATQQDLYGTKPEDVENCEYYKENK